MSEPTSGGAIEENGKVSAPKKAAAPTAETIHPWFGREETVLWTILRMFARIGTSVVFDLKVWGVENVPRTGGVLLVSNHQSYLDPVLLGVRLPRPLTFLAKSQLFKVPGLRWLITNLHAFPVRQGEGDVGAMRESIRRLQEGKVLVVFPEGSRTPDGELLPIEPGVALMVRKAGVPIVPVVIWGSHEAWPKGTPIFHSGKIRVQYGPVIDVKGMKAAAVVKEIERVLQGMYGELRGRVKEEGR